MLLDRLIQRCPDCGHLSRQKILEEKVAGSERGDTMQRYTYNGSHVDTFEPWFNIKLTYEVLRQCKSCGFRWKTAKTVVVPQRKGGWGLSSY